MPKLEVTPLVSVDRERFLRQNEAKIRSAASAALSANDHILQHAYNALLYCEDIIDRHAVAVTANRAANREHVAIEHERFVEKGMQLKLRTLDQLTHIIGY